MSQSEEELRKQVEELKAQLESERSKGRKDLHLKVSEKGGVSLYGIRRFPITFYQEEWARILEMADEIQRFIAENREQLAKKR